MSSFSISAAPYPTRRGGPRRASAAALFCALRLTISGWLGAHGPVLVVGAGTGRDGLANQLAFHFRQVQDANRLRAQPLDDGWRRLCRRIEAEPQRLLEARDAGLGQRWNFRQRGEALLPDGG